MSVIPIEDNQLSIQLAPYLDYLPTADRERDPQKVNAIARSKGTAADKAPLTISDDLRWYAVKVSNRSGREIDLILQYKANTLYELHVYQFHQQQLIKQTITGDKYPFNSRPLKIRYYTVPLTLAVDEQQTLLIAVREKLALLVDKLHLSTASMMVAENDTDAWSDWFLFGSIITLIIYNLVTYFTISDRSYLFFVFWLACIFLIFVEHFDYATIVFWSNPHWWTRHELTFLIPLSVMFMLLYADSLMGLRVHAPRIHQTLKSGCIVMLILAVASLFVPDTEIRTSMNLILFVGLSFFLVTVYTSTSLWVVAGDTNARNYSLIWGLAIAFLVVSYGLSLMTDWQGFNSTLVKLFLASLLMMMSAILSVSISRMREKEQEALAQSKAKSEFLANMSHEIRTPMNAILGFSELMQNEPAVSESQKKFLDIIQNAGNHLLGLINDILDISKIEAGRVTLVPTNFDVKRMLRDMEQIFLTSAEKKGLKLNFEGVDTNALIIQTDENKLRQILINLLGNAVKFTQRGYVSCRLESSRLDDNTTKLSIEIEDTGPGIAREEEGKVFEKFEQTEAGHKTQGGTGLGLAISRKFAQLMGGDISFTSEVGVGTTFRFALKTGLGQTSALEDKQPRIIAIAPGQASMKILVVDDKENNRSLLMNILQQVGFKVLEASDGKQALVQFEQAQPNLILMDMHMPLMGGLEACQKIRAVKQGKTIPIIAVTASAFDDERQAFLDQGIDDVISKPIRRQVVLEAIGRHLQLKYDHAEDTA